MANTLRYLSAYDGYLPEATGQVIAFAQKESAFSLNEYVQFYETQYSVATYQQLSRDGFVRVASVNEDVWEDGDTRPTGNDRQVKHVFIPFKTQRRERGTMIGHKAIEQTQGWKPKVTFQDVALSQTMTAMTQRVVTLLTTTANWSGQQADANALNGGFGNWVNATSDPASPNYYAILKTLQKVSLFVHLLTNGAVKPSALKFIVNPALAAAMAVTPEINEYCRSSPAALQITEKGLGGERNQMSGLPKFYRGFEFVIEDAPIVTAIDTATEAEETVSDVTSTTATRRYIMPYNQCICVSRVGALEGEVTGAPNFSTVQIPYYRRRMEVEGFNDVENRRFRTSVVVDQAEVLAAPVAGFEITNVA